MVAKSKWKQMDLFAHNQPAGYAAPKSPEDLTRRHLGRALALFAAMMNQSRQKAWLPSVDRAHRDFAEAVRKIAKVTDLRPLRSAVPDTLGPKADAELMRCLEACATLPEHEGALQSARQAVAVLMGLIEHERQSTQRERR